MAGKRKEIGKMKSKELCEMCAEYSAETKCEYKKECKLQSILTENMRLKNENRKLKKRIEECEIAKRWSIYPDTMGK